MKKPCKYCKSTEHIIDSCPEILCKICNERGHPHWKCKVKVTEKKPEINEIKIDKEKIIKPCREKSSDCPTLDSIDDYMNIINIPWGELKL
jgi:hypothetical protein